MIAENIKAVTERIKGACARADRKPEEVTLVCVTKEVSPENTAAALKAGITDIGESRVQAACLKYDTLRDNKLTWHLIGHLQRNKVRDAVRIFDLIHAVDSVRLAQAIDKEAIKQKKLTDILVQVNVSGEGSKFGIQPKKVLSFVRDVRTLSNIRLLGFMTMAPLVDNPESTRPHFRKLKEIFDETNKHFPALKLECLSMGMTQDFEVAIEEGATLVRIGTAIFRH